MTVNFDNMQITNYTWLKEVVARQIKIRKCEEDGSVYDLETKLEVCNDLGLIDFRQHYDLFYHLQHEIQFDKNKFKIVLISSATGKVVGEHLAKCNSLLDVVEVEIDEIMRDYPEDEIMWDIVAVD